VDHGALKESRQLDEGFYYFGKQVHCSQAPSLAEETGEAKLAMKREFLEFPSWWVFWGEPLGFSI
jgi:hypothetical protein